MNNSNPGSLKRIRKQDSEQRSISPTPSECSEASSFALSDFDTRRSSGKPLRIAIEGNIAAGKSTFLKILEDLQDEQPDYHWYVQPEPLAKWTKKDNMEHTEVNDEASSSSAETSSSTKSQLLSPNAPRAGGDDTKKANPVPSEILNGEESNASTRSDDGGANLLEAFYKDPERWAYTFEAYTFISRMHQAREAELQVQEDMKLAGAQPNAITFFERSVYSSRLVFAENSYESGSMSATEWAIYCDWTNFVLKTVKELKLDGIVYLQCDPKVCHERMLKRSRSEEGGVPYEYLQALDEKYENWIGPDGWMQIKDQADTCPKTPPKNNPRVGNPGLEISTKSGIHSVVERTLADVPVLVLNCSEEFKSNAENRNQMIACVREWLASRVVIEHDDLDEANEDDGQVFKDLTNNRGIFKSPTKRPAETTITLSDDEENETPRSSLPKAFKKDHTVVE